MTYILMAILVLMFVWAMTPGLGKFWHKHEWYHHIHLEAPHIYSDKKIDIHDAYKCGKDNCWAFKLDTYTVKAG